MPTETKSNVFSAMNRMYDSFSSLGAIAQLLAAKDGKFTADWGGMKKVITEAFRHTRTQIRPRNGFRPGPLPPHAIPLLERIDSIRGYSGPTKRRPSCFSGKELKEIDEAIMIEASAKRIRKQSKNLSIVNSGGMIAA